MTINYSFLDDLHVRVAALESALKFPGKPIMNPEELRLRAVISKAFYTLKIDGENTRLVATILKDGLL